ncbi:Protocadherin-11 X-linked [Cichlidogyrus casuarinus]|uniref:Protocadherin-11 X-linked n=1 Tax=Cichlidogyrus casuarinus TaxID=1844966 RepID=A0ABD2QKM6_9PLAT
MDGEKTKEIESRMRAFKSDGFGSSAHEPVGNSNPQRRVHLHSTEVMVSVTDKNDNTPQFLRPNRTDHMVVVDPSTPMGAIIYTVTCLDPDTGLNGKISYEIMESNDDGLFSIQNHNGNIHLDRNLPEDVVNKAKLLSEKQIGSDERSRLSRDNLQDAYPSYNLKLRACDNGAPQSQCSEFPNLKIQVRVLTGDSLYLNEAKGLRGEHFWGRRSWHENVIITVSVVSFFVVLLFIGIFVFSRCRVHYSLRKRAALRQGE